LSACGSRACARGRWRDRNQRPAWNPRWFGPKGPQGRPPVHRDAPAGRV